MLSYSRARGLFAGVSLKGASIRPDLKANERYYGKPFRTRDIVLDGKAGTLESAVDWRETLAKYFKAS